MGKLLEMVDVLVVTGSIRLDEAEYELVTEADEYLDSWSLDLNNLYKNMVLENKTEFLNYLRFVKRIGYNKCTSDKYKEYMNRIEKLRVLRSKFFIRDRYSFMNTVVMELSQLSRNFDIDKLLNKLKICDLFFYDDAIFIRGHKYMLMDINENEYKYKIFIRYGNYERIDGNIGLMLVMPSGDISYYDSDKIKSGRDKVKIVKEIGIDNIDLIITRRNMGDDDFI